MRHSVYVSNSPTGAEINQSRFESVLSSIPTNTRINFRRGDTFEIGGKNLDDKGTKVQAYKYGADPILSGSQDISSLSWTNVSGNLWSASLASTPKWVFKNGVAATWAQSIFLNIDARPSSTQISGDHTVINPAFTSSLVGAEVRIIEDRWIMSYAYTVTAYDDTNGHITLDRTILGTTPVGGRFIFLNQLQFVNLQDEWWYDASTTTLYYYSTTNPNTLNLRASFQDYAFNLQADNISFDGLDFSHYYFSAINALSSSSHNLNVNACKFHDNKNYGIYAVSCDGYSITNSDFQRMTNGIARTGNNWHVESNTFNNMGMDSNYPLPIGDYQSTGNAILLWGANTILRRNTINNTAYCGTLTTGYNNIIDRNDISNFCARFDDGAAIYTAGVGTMGTTNTGGYIHLNHIHENASHASYPATTAAIGVYIDNRTTNYTIDENTIYDLGQGSTSWAILGNWDTQNTSVLNNIISNATVGVKFRNDSTNSPLYGNNEGNVMTGNKIAASTNTQFNVEVEDFNGSTTYNPFSGGGVINNNNYMIPYSTNMARRRSTLNGTATNYTFANWKTNISGDASSTVIANLYSYTTPRTSAVEVLHSVNNTESTITPSIGADYTDEAGNTVTSRTITDYSSAISVSTTKRDVLFSEDTFTGSAGNITGHTPDIGPAWTVETGTISLNGSGRVESTVAGEMWIDLGQPNALIELTGRVTTTPLTMHILFRYTDVNNYIAAQLFIPTVAGDVRVIVTNRVSGTSTQIVSVDPGSATPNTDYKITARLTGTGTSCNLKISVDDVQYVDYTDSSSPDIGVNNPTGTKHGIRIPVGVNYTSWKMWDF